MRKIKNEFMTHWDGLLTKPGERILVLAATNRPFDLDEAIIRRFERRYFYSLTPIIYLLNCFFQSFELIFTSMLYNLKLHCWSSYISKNKFWKKKNKRQKESQIFFLIGLNYMMMALSFSTLGWRSYSLIAIFIDIMDSVDIIYLEHKFENQHNCYPAFVMCFC